MSRGIFLFIAMSFCFISWCQEINQYDENGMKSGHWKNYKYLNKGMANEDSILVSEGPFEAGRKSGQWKFYHEDESLRMIQNFKFDKRVGKFQSFHKNGKLKEEGFFWRARYQGAQLKFYESGCLQYRCVQDSVYKKQIEVFYNDDCNGKTRGSVKDSISYLPKDDDRKFRDESLMKIGTTNKGVLIKGKYESMANNADAGDCKYEEELKKLGDFSGTKEIKDANGNVLWTGSIKKGAYWTGTMHCYDENGKRIKTKEYTDMKIMKVTRY